MATKRMKMNFDTTAVLKGLRDIDVTLNSILTTRNKNITAEKKEREKEVQDAYDVFMKKLEEIGLPCRIPCS